MLPIANLNWKKFCSIILINNSVKAKNYISSKIAILELMMII